MPEQRRKALTSYSQAGTYVGSGFQFAGTIVAGLFGGRWIDDKLSTTPLFLVTGILLGAVAGFYYLYKALVREPPEPPEPDTGPGDSENEEGRGEGKS